MQSIFVTGIGTDIGKTVVSAILAEALQADYWKPVQAGFEDGTDAGRIRSLISNNQSTIYPETYKLKMPASPHIAAREEGIEIEIETIYKDYLSIQKYQQSQDEDRSNKYLIIEGAGGLIVPLNNKTFIIDVIKKINAKVVLVSRNYLGSINHSLLTAEVCRSQNLDVLGWVFNDQYLHYEDEIAQWSGYGKLASIPAVQNVDKDFVAAQAAVLKKSIEML
ncbi:MAG: dethiobiotin synthase [Bacteroidetes bacterium]|nr:dethiobiotin synthase [Bacteroidota bacterium]